MKAYFFIFIFWPFLLAGANFEKLNEQNFLETKESFLSNSDNIKIVEKRWLDKRFLSEASLGLSYFLKGFLYTDSWSGEVSYRLFFNDYFSFNMTYSHYLNPITKQGAKEISFYGRIPLELKYFHKKSYLIGLDWYPFYGKAVLYNHLVYFDFYLSLKGGQIELEGLSKKAPLLSGSFGVVQWWNKRFNTRIELDVSHYKYDIPNTNSQINREVFYKLNFSTGVLF